MANMLPTLVIFCMILLTPALSKTSLDILVMGDWGGAPSSPFTTPDELDSAKIMGEIGTSFEVDMVWGLGDNFYDDGVKDEYDSRFQETFEDVFTASSLQSIPFYMVAGNHDHNGNVSGQFFYSNHSSRWTFPNYWYTETFKVADTSHTLQLVMIDTVLLEGMSYSAEYCDAHGMAECPIQPKGPADAILAASQYDWIENTLEASEASYLIVAGHYPVWSIAEHGSTKGLVDTLLPIMQKNNVSAYISGHDHTFEYIEYEGIDYIDTGGTHVCDRSQANANSIPRGSLKFHGCEDGGFTRIRVNATGMSVFYYYGSDSMIKYTVPIRGARN